MVHYLVHWHVILKTNMFATKGEYPQLEIIRRLVPLCNLTPLHPWWQIGQWGPTIITGRRNILKRSQKIGRSCNAEPQGCYNCWSIVVDRQIGIGKLSSRESKWKLSHIISPFNLSVSTQHVRVVRGNITHLLSINTGAVPSSSGLFEVRSYRSYDETTQLPTNILEMGVTTYDIKWYNPDTVHIYLASTPHWVVYQVQIC